MAEILYDSGWVPSASGTIKTVVNVSSCSAVRLLLAASGSGGTSASAGWTSGLDTPSPWTKNTPPWPMNPKITGSYTLGVVPAANDFHAYFLGAGLSGTGYPTASGTGGSVLDTYVPTFLYAECAVSASSWGRVIVEGF